MKCKKCGHEFDGNFCPQCGTPAENSGSAPVTVQTSEPVKSKKKNHGCLIAIVVIVVLGIIGAGMSPDDAESDSAASSAVSTSTPTSAPTAEPTQVPSPTQEPISTPTPEIDSAAVPAESSEPLMSMDATAAVIEALVADNFQNYTLDYDETGITLSLWQEGLAAEALLAASGDQDALDGWSNLKDNLVYFCDSVSDAMETAGHGDAILMVNVLNDQNTENILLSALNSVIIYDAVEG